MSQQLPDALERSVLLADGAMGTELQRVGLEPGACGEAWNIEHPERVLAIQRAYVDAGSDCLITNTLGGSRIMLGRHGHADDVVEIARAAVRIARDAFADRPGFVLGDIGPLGGLIEPYGDISESAAREALAEQASALVDAGVDAIIIETQSSLEELGIAISAARKAGASYVIGSVAFAVTHDGRDLRTMMGVDPEKAARFMADAGADALGVNCGSGVDAARAAQAIQRYRSVCDLPTVAQPNAGQPVLENLQVIYEQAPGVMAAQVHDLLAAGVGMVGGCCGTTPQHIRLFRAVLDAWNAGPP
jgi:5-methyltetrahydrofolate--homocysteine methyltransferase